MICLPASKSTGLTFCMDTKKRERGRAWLHRQSRESTIESKQNANPVQLQNTELNGTDSLRQGWGTCSLLGP
jgi:hypothetical protein